MKPSFQTKGFKRMVGNFRRINQTLAIEYTANEETLQKESDARQNIKSFSDLIEGSPGDAGMTPLTEQYGLIALGQSNTSLTWDLSTPEGRRLWKKTIVTWKPMLATMSFHSNVWNFENEQGNYKNYQQLLQRRQELDRPLLQLVQWTCHEQASSGRVFLINGPSTSRALREPE